MPQKRSLYADINDLKVQQRAAREDRQRLAKELRNAQRRKRRLQGKARQLTNADLLMVLTMRGETSEVKGSGASSSQTPDAGHADMSSGVYGAAEHEKTMSTDTV